jgi:hypothetical protein
MNINAGHVRGRALIREAYRSAGEASRRAGGGHRAAICRSPAKRPLNIVDVSLNKRSMNIVHAGFNTRHLNNDDLRLTMCEFFLPDRALVAKLVRPKEEAIAGTLHKARPVEGPGLEGIRFARLLAFAEFGDDGEVF